MGTLSINKRYVLLSPKNAEVTIARIDMENFLCGKNKRDNKRYDYYLIRLRKKDNESYASKISQQKILLPIIPVWRSKQRYFRMNTDKQVIDTLLDNKEVFKDDIKELDQNLILHQMKMIQNLSCYHRQQQRNEKPLMKSNCCRMSQDRVIGVVYIHRTRESSEAIPRCVPFHEHRAKS